MTSDRINMLGLFLTASMIAGVPSVATSEETDSLVDIFGDATGDEVPLFLAVSINGKDTGLVAEFSAGLDGGNMRSTRSELTQIGLQVPPRMAQNIALHDIDGVRYTYDPVEQSLDIQAPYSALRPDIRSASYAQDFEEPDRAYGAVVNYSVVADRGFGGDFSGPNGGLSANLDGWVFAPFGQFRSTAYFSRPFASAAKDQNLRLETTLTTHIPDKALTVSVGDFTTAGPSWTRPIRMGGVQVRRDFSLRSDLVTDQRLSYAGAAAVPSSVDVFIENNRVYSTNVDSGPYQLEDVPIQGGGDAEIVVRGIDGQVSRRTVSFFDASNLLKKGVADYSFGIGFAREAFGFSSNEYGGSPIFNGSFRYGATERLTFNTHVSGTEDLLVVGGGITAIPYALGEVTANIAASQYEGETGGFAQVGLRTQIGDVDLNVSSSRATSDYADVALVTGLDYLDSTGVQGTLLEVAKAQDVVSLSIPVTKSGRRLGLSYVRAERATSKDSLASLSFGSSLGKGRGSFSLNTAYNFESEEARLSMGLSMRLGKRRYAQASAYTDSEGRQTQDISYTRSQGDGIGAWGYHLQAAHRDDGRTPVRAKGDLRTQYGELSGEVQTDQGGTYTRTQFDGAVAYTGGAMAMGNQVRDGFALVDVGVSDVPVYLDNRKVAKTNNRGRVLVNGLNAYRRNRVSVDVADLPEDATLGVSAADLIPSRGGGQLVSFGGSDEAGVIVVLRDPSGAVLDPGAIVYPNGNAQETYVGYDGETWIDSPRRTNVLRVETERGTCTARFGYQPGAAGQGRIDPVECR